MRNMRESKNKKFQVQIKKSSVNADLFQNLSRKNSFAQLALAAFKNSGVCMSSILTGHLLRDGAVFKAHVSYEQADLPKTIKLKNCMYERRMEPSLILEFPLSATQAEKRDWIKVADRYFKKLLVREAYLSKKGTKNITFMQAKAGNGTVSQRKSFINNRNKWITKRYGILFKKFDQDICYESICKELRVIGNKNPQFFGAWNWIEKAKVADPFTLKYDTVKYTVGHSSSNNLIIP